MLDVFADTPTGNQRDPPSTSFSRAERLHPSGVRLRSARCARLRSASPQRGEAGWKKDKLQKANYTGLLLLGLLFLLARSLLLVFLFFGFANICSELGIAEKIAERFTVDACSRYRQLAGMKIECHRPP